MDNNYTPTLLLVLLFLLIPESLYAYNDIVHQPITEVSVVTSKIDDSLINLGYGLGIKTEIYNNQGEIKPIVDWIAEGGVREDDSLDKCKPEQTRASNHFHDPTKSWDAAFFDDDMNATYTREYGRPPVSALLWGLNFIDDGDLQKSVQVFDKNTTGDWSWPKARTLFYDSLTSQLSSERENKFADSLRALGQVAHLIQDMSVPAHTRNDPHVFPLTSPARPCWPGLFRDLLGTLASVPPFPWHYETFTWDWATNDYEDFENYVYNLSPVFPSQDIFTPVIQNYDENYLINGTPKLSPVSGLFDTNAGGDETPLTLFANDIGLSEYSNGNFFSKDTIFSYSHPSKDDTTYGAIMRTARDDKVDFVLHYYRVTDTQKEHPVAALKYWAENVADPELEVNYLDNDVFASYASFLIPRAIGYSAALIDYFFRGKLDIQSPVFSFGSDQSITGVRGLQVQNLTSLDNRQTVEKFGPGELHLVYYYTPDGAGEPVYHIVDNPVYQIDDVNDPINSGYVTIDTIDFDAEESVPLDIAPEEITMLLVFRGKLGNEENGIAAQTFTGITNSRIAYYSQPGGRPNTSNVYTISPDGSHPYQVTSATEPNPWYFSPAWSKDGTMMAFENHFCTDPNPDPFCSGEHYFRNIVVVDLLSEQQYPDNVLYEINYNDAPVAVPSFSPDGTMIAAIMQNMSGFGYNANVVVFDLESGDHWIVNADDDPNLTDLGRSGPAWSPDGDKIAYYLEQQYDQESGTMKGEGDLFIINPDGTGKIRLTDDDFKNTQPSWSPDGEWIVFSSDRDGEASMDIWMMDMNGENLRRLFDCTPASCYGPTFSPDGRRVAFSNGSSIYIVDSNGDPYSMEEIAEIGLLMGDLNWSPYLVPPSMDVQAEPSIITVGGSSTLSWRSSRATEIIFSGTADKQSSNGSIEVSPDSTTTYTLTAIGPTGTNEKAITVTVQ